MNPFQNYPKNRPLSLGKGIWLEQMRPSNALGPGAPNEESGADRPWRNSFMLGDVSDAFQLLLVDIRNPAGHRLPPLWHECWNATILLEGGYAIGDWVMEQGDVAIVAPGVEHGPIQTGPSGAQILKAYAKMHLGEGFFGAEHSDSPALVRSTANFVERSTHDGYAEGRSVLPVDGLNGFVRGRLAHGAAWDLGEPDDPERGALRYAVLAPGETLQPRRLQDWSALVVVKGHMRLGSHELVRHDILTIAPGGVVDVTQAGTEGVELLEILRTAPGPRPVFHPVPAPEH